MGRSRNDGRGRFRPDRPRGHTQTSFYAITSCGRFKLNMTAPSFPLRDGGEAVKREALALAENQPGELIRVEQEAKTVLWTSKNHS